MGVIEVGNCARYAQDAVIRARAERQLIRGADQEGARIGFELGGGRDQAHRCGGVGERSQRLRIGGVAVSAALTLAGGEHALAYGGGACAWGVGGEIVGGDALHVYVQVNAIGEGA